MRILRFLVSILLVSAVGIAGYMWIEGWDFLSAFYMTIITLTTTGYEEVHPLSPQGRIFTAFFLLTGFGVFAFFLSSIIQEVVSLELDRVFMRRNMQKKISAMSGHTILCGYGRMGQSIAEQLRDAGQKFVVIETNREKEGELVKTGVPFVIGNASDDDVLTSVGIDRAKNLISVVTSDSENVFISLSARSLNRELNIITRSYNEGSREKMKKAGANKVISPNNLMSTKITQSILNPAVDDFLEVAAGDEKIDFQLADILVGESSRYKDRDLAHSEFHERGIVIVGIRKRDGKLVYAPTSCEVVEQGDRLIVLGSGEGFKEFLGEEA